MEVAEISGKLIRPDGTEEYWWNGINYHNVIPEEIIDAELQRALKNITEIEKEKTKWE